MRKKEIMMTVQSAVAAIEVGGNTLLRYVDKDWGQLNTETPAVHFPCVLVDIENVSYRHTSCGERADAEVVVTYANLRTVSSSATSPDIAVSYSGMDNLEAINDAITAIESDQHTALIRTGFSKVQAGTGYECYQMTYKVSW